jgi:preprotein translocase subunit SecE
MKFPLINDSWVQTGIVWVLAVALIVVVVKKWARITSFSGEVRGELHKASWPWESDPKIKGLRKYRELVDSTTVVLIAMILLAGFVQAWDFLHVQIVTFLTNFGR